MGDLSYGTKQQSKYESKAGTITKNLGCRVEDFGLELVGRK